MIGHPVAHSLSPSMQNAAFRAAGRNAAYVALDVPPPRLAEALAGLHAAGFAGLNVTLPHKEEALRLSISATAGARAAGAANTLRWAAEGWEADATDGPGLLAWLAALRIPAAGARVLVAGAGGASRSVAAALASGGAAAVTIVNRTPERAAAVAAAARQVAGPDARVDTAPWGGAGESSGVFDFLVRAVSVEEVAAEERRWWGRVSPGGAVLDLNYGSRARAAREEARTMGIRFEDGLALLVEQGALSYEFWTGDPAPRRAMREALG
ncbi:MAG TPA: shikimate dehydrogenase (NADP+) [Candidatus Binatia bacterium]|nr:shikimate dehydrogenase (NADP+) [Candidatus Binatia bacterium]